MANKYGFSSVNRQVNFQDSKGLQVSSQIEEINKKFIYARVVDIILNERHPKFEELGGWSSIGTIFYLDVEVSTNSLNNSLIAKPLLSNSKNYPLVNEFVLLFLLPDNQVSLGSNIKKYFYLNPIPKRRIIIYCPTLSTKKLPSNRTGANKKIF